MNRQKDVNRFSYSRLSTYQQCPRKHSYMYVEQIEPAALNQFTVPGKLFHEAIEKILNKEDPDPIFKKFRALCQSGELDREADLLELLVTEYMNYYKKAYARENTLLVEHQSEDQFDEDHYFTAVIDQVYERDGILTIRDLKTTSGSFKWDFEKVKTSPQLLIYALYAEEKIGQPIDAIEIDEVRLAKLEEPPINNNGKPSADKRRLTNVTYEAFYNALEERGLEDDKSYKDVLQYLEDRGHPLFKRTSFQLLSQEMIQNNLEDLRELYESMLENRKFRTRGPLCNYCDYKQLCELDLHGSTTEDREILITHIQRKR